MTTGPLVNSLLVVGIVAAVATVAALAFARLVWWAATALAWLLLPVTRYRRERESARRARSIAAIRAERDEVRRAWAAERAARKEEA